MESRNSANYLRNINAGNNNFCTILATDAGSVSLRSSRTLSETGITALFKRKPHTWIVNLLLPILVEKALSKFKDHFYLTDTVYELKTVCFIN